jgi:hypothetical protein
MIFYDILQSHKVILLQTSYLFTPEMNSLILRFQTNYPNKFAVLIPKGTGFHDYNVHMNYIISDADDLQYSLETRQFTLQGTT